MRGPYGGCQHIRNQSCNRCASFSLASQSEHSYTADIQFSPQQARHDGLPRVLQSTSENIRPSSHMSHAQNAFTKPNPLQAQPGTMEARRLLERLDLPEESEILYHAHAIKKLDTKKGNPRPQSKVRETQKLWKSIPAAATKADCSPGSGYYKYRVVDKKELCKKQWCKDNAPHVLWPEEVEKSFQFWIRTIKPMGKKKVMATVLDYEDEDAAKQNCFYPGETHKQCGRNELISYMIYLDTKVVCDRKRISSHIQVLRHHLKRPNDHIFFKDDGVVCSHDEGAMEYENWGKLAWDKDLKRIVPAPRPSDDNRSSLRSSYVLSSHLSEYPSSAMCMSQQSSLPEGSPPRFKEMQFQLYVTLKEGPNDKRLHTYTQAQQGTSAESLSIHDIADSCLSFPAAEHYSGSSPQEQLLYCEASLVMRHELTEKGLQVGPEMQITLSCLPDYRDWYVKTSGYRNRGRELVCTEQRICEWQRGNGDQVTVKIWANANFWAQLLFDCRVAYEGPQPEPRVTYENKGFERLSGLEPSQRSEAVLEEASFVQEIYASSGTVNGPVRVAVLLWRFRQAAEGEVGLWTWRHVDKNPVSGPSSTQLYTPYRSTTRATNQSFKYQAGDRATNDASDFDFNDLQMELPGQRIGVQSPVRLTMRKSTDMDCMNITTSTEGMQSEPIPPEQFPSDDTLRFDTHTRCDTSFLDLEDGTQTSLSSNPSSAYPEANTPTEIESGAPSHPEHAFSFNFDANVDELPILPDGWENLALDFSKIPGLETPARCTDANKQNRSIQQQQYLFSLTPVAFKHEFQPQTFGLPIDPALAKWATPTPARTRVRDETEDELGDDRPAKRRKTDIARALTYLPPVPQAHVLKSTQEEIESSPDQTTPTNKKLNLHSTQLGAPTSTSRLQNIGSLRDNQTTPSQGFLEPYRSESQGQFSFAQNCVQQTHDEAQTPDATSISTQSFQSIHDPSLESQSQSQIHFSFDDHNSSFISHNETSAESQYQNSHSRQATNAAFDPQTYTSQSVDTSWQQIGNMPDLHVNHSYSNNDPEPHPQSQIQTQSTDITGDNDHSDAAWHNLSLSTLSHPEPPSLSSLSHPSESFTTSDPPPNNLDQPAPNGRHGQSPTHSYTSIEELCGDEVQLAHLSYAKVCDDGANLAQLAQIQHAAMRECLKQDLPEDLAVDHNLTVFNFNNAINGNGLSGHGAGASATGGERSRQRPSLARSGYPSTQSVRSVHSVHSPASGVGSSLGAGGGAGHSGNTTLSRYPSFATSTTLSGLEASITAAVKAGPRSAQQGTSLSREQNGVGGLEPYHSQPWTGGSDFVGGSARTNLSGSGGIL